MSISEKKEFSLPDIYFLYKTIISNFKTIFQSIIFFVFLGLLFFAISEKKYISQAKIFPNSSDSNTSILTQAQNFGFNVESLGSEGIYSSDIYESILKSRKLARATIQNKFSLNESDTDKKPLYQILYGENKNKISNEEMISIGIDRFINDNLSVYKAPGKSIITISMITNNAFLSKTILDSLLINMNEIYIEHNLSNNLLTLEFLQERIEANNKELNSLEKKYEDFLIKNKNYRDSVSLIIQQDRILRELDVLKSLSLTLKRQYEAIKLETIDKSAAIDILDYPEVPFDYYSPSLIFNLMIGAIIGFLFSITRIYFKIISQSRLNPN